MRSPSLSTFRTAAPARAAISLLVWGLVQAVACGGKTPVQPPPPPPPPEQLQMSCPESIVAEATTLEGTDVHFDSPSPTGGTAPYTVECSPGSGSVFPIEETTVQCTASDADMKQTACGFSVRVRVSRTLSRTRFTAFGDSITTGVVSLAPLVTLGLPGAYPSQLEQMLLTRYPTQTFVVTNQGVSGETTRRGASRLPGVLDADRPEVLLLLEGTNNVRGLSASTQADYLESMIEEAQERHVDVIIATVMAVSPAFEDDHRGVMAAIRALNQRIIRLALEYNLGSPVDLFTLFEANPHLLGQDGLHPTMEGQARIAESFRDEIVRRYETRSTVTPRLSSMLVSDAR